MKVRKKIDKYLINTGIGLLIAALVVGIISLLLKLPAARQWYDQYTEILSTFEMAVASIDKLYIFIATIILLFCLKSVIPFIPFSALCLISGMVLPKFQAVVINVIGSLIWISIKYLWGVALGSGYVTKILKKSQKIKDVIENKGINPWLLFAFRAVPYFPLNTVSQLCGSMHFNIPMYLAVSIAGLMPRIVAYAIAGGSLFDPFSFSFFLPIILLLVFSGFATLIMGVIIRKSNAIKQKNKDGD